MEKEIEWNLREMLFELQNNHLQVVLVKQINPPNPGACIRIVVSRNADWYRKLCSEFESKKKSKSIKFKTKVKRQRVFNILHRLIHGEEVKSKYAEWIMKYAENMIIS